MTKAEIIRKLAKRVGVQDLDAKIFFEVFLRKVSLQLNPGETIKIKNIGFFQMRTGKIRNSSDNNLKPDYQLTDIIIYHPLPDQQDEFLGNLIFNIPNKTEDEYNIIDSYFSLSFGKPVIPLKDANVSEYFIPPTGNELRRLYDSKADKLLREIEVVEDYLKGEEILLIDPEMINPNQMEINWDEIHNEQASPDKVPDSSSQDSSKDSEIYSWTFGDELEKEIEEDALLDTGNEDNLFVDYDDLKDLSWDFGDTVENKEEIAGKFQRVNSFASDYHISQDEIVPTDASPSDDSELLNSINEELNDEGFAEIKHIPREFKFEPVMSPKKEELPPPPEIAQEIEEPETPGSLIPEPYDYPQHYKLNESTAHYGPKKWLGLYVALAILLVLAGSVLLYIKVLNPYYAGVKKPLQAKVDPYHTPPVIIERDYQIPVTYPYTKDTNVVQPFDPIDKKVFDKKDNSGNNNSVSPDQKDKNNTSASVQQVAPPPVENKIRNNQPPAETKVKNNKQPAVTIANNSKQPSTRVKDFIYKSGDNYLVQISSWSSKSKALEQASYIHQKGYQTSIEMANLSRGTFYRVKVGNFKSENEAEQFYNKYK